MRSRAYYIVRGLVRFTVFAAITLGVFYLSGFVG
jgi:hypothetical protein